MDCLFCFELEPEYKPETRIDFVCSWCVQMFLGADQQDLKTAHSKAIEKGYQNKAKAIESFLIPEEYSARKTKNDKRSLVRERPLRTVRPSRHQLRSQPTTV
jgi:hypothetical protein